ncbi:DUF58 domain-containing protein [Paenibacillus sp. HB172176]|uniref:DUF58 domain-containing protein n=1 Tax=Paenibacillus sp. HB172176 TaxID=2493690 RepID=UPI0014390D8E|nr:DUF58 domain-containing protein [Paenibacillus sp. HB172176]
MAILWFVITAVLLMGAQTYLFKKWALSKLTFERRFSSKTCFNGETVEWVEQLSNRKWLPVPWLRVESQLSSHLRFGKQENLDVSSGQMYQNHRSFFTLAPYTKITRTHRITPDKRGWYKMNTVTLTGGDLLGSAQNSIQLSLQEELIVFPLPAEVPLDQLPFRSWQGENPVRRHVITDPFSIAGTRGYQPGDTLRQVNWKATARTGELQVHQYDYTATRCMMIYLNAEDVEGMWRAISNEALIERGIEWAAGVAERVIAQGMQVGFMANMPIMGTIESAYAEPLSGQDHLYGLYELMAKLAMERTQKFTELLEEAVELRYANRDVLLLSAYWNDELEQLAEELRHNGNAVASWLIPEKNEGAKTGSAGKEGVA